MTPQMNQRTGDDGKGPHSWATEALGPFVTPIPDPLAGLPIEVASRTVSSLLSTASEYGSSISYPPNTERPSRSPTFLHRPPSGFMTMSTPMSSTLSNVLPLWETQGWRTSYVTSSPTPFATQYATPTATATSDESGDPRHVWNQPKGTSHGAGLYAAAAIVPIVVLAVIGYIAFFCLRKRRRQREEAAAAQMKAEEMKMHLRPQTTTQSYLAHPQLVPPPQYTASHNHPPSLFAPGPAQPIILGPIPSGANGAYFTGMDTSDVISMNSANSLRRTAPDPFSNNNNSLSEPPPPYRPRSTAPPSFVTSRHSSLRAPLVTSQTHLIERSPFEDPTDDDDDDDDAVSELSGPTRGRDEDAMSAVSDLSYQNDPVVTRTSL
jgi:hypothetical protein